MPEVAQNYRIINPASLEDLANQVNRVFAMMADRADGQEGRRGNPKFYNEINLNLNKLTEGVPATATTDVPIYDQVPQLSEFLNSAWPIGSIFTSTVATDPATLIGIGTWAAFGSGKVLVGLDSSDADYDTAEETGGSKTHALGDHTHSTPAHTHPNGTQVDNNLDLSTTLVKDGNGGAGTTGAAGAETIKVVQPYIVVYFWKRTA